MGMGGNFNVYDVTKSCNFDLCYQGIADVATYLDQPAVLKALNVAPFFTKWVSCNSSVYSAIATPDWFNQEEYTIPVLLDEIRVQIYAGANDWICNHQGNYLWFPRWTGTARASGTALLAKFGRLLTERPSRDTS